MANGDSEAERGVRLSGGGTARTLGEAWLGYRRWRDAMLKGTVSRADDEREGDLFYAGAHTALLLMATMCRGRSSAESQGVVDGLLGEVRERSERAAKKRVVKAWRNRGMN